MIRKAVIGSMLVALAAATAPAQDARVELSGTAGWTFSDGVNVGSAENSPIRVDPKDAFSWGARLGFLFNMQGTDLEASGVINRSVSQNIYNYHGYVAYNFGDQDQQVRPYVLGGLGATQFGSLQTATGDIGGETQFSSTWAAGLKIFPNPRVGLRLEGRWTPTYVKSDPAGYWCDPYWGCFAFSDAEFANQFELSGGVTLRF